MRTIISIIVFSATLGCGTTHASNDSITGWKFDCPATVLSSMKKSEREGFLHEGREWSTFVVERLPSDHLTLPAINQGEVFTYTPRWAGKAVNEPAPLPVVFIDGYFVLATDKNLAIVDVASDPNEGAELAYRFGGCVATLDSNTDPTHGVTFLDRTLGEPKYYEFDEKTGTVVPIN